MSMGTFLRRALFAGVLMVCDVVAAPAMAQQPAGDRTLAITHVTVIPMDSERTLPDHTVIVRNGRIVEVAPSRDVRVPGDAQVIDGRGRWLMPGLADMHIHVVSGTGQPGDGAWQQMTLLVANGVTTARSLAGAPTAPAVRDAIRTGALTGPQLYLAGASLNHNSVKTPDAARAAVQQQKAAGMDFIKTHGVTSDVYDAIIDAARAANMPVSGHVVPDYGLARAIAAGQQVEHLDGYLAATIPEDAAVTVPPGQLFFGPELNAMRESAMPALARMTKEAGVWNGPTLALFEIVANPQPAAHYLARPEARYIPKAARDGWSAQLAGVAQIEATPAQRARYTELRRAMTRALLAEGAGILAGSDSPQFFMLPGFALHYEIEALQRAGLTPYQALAAATANPARYFGEVMGANAATDFGRVAVGLQADLLLLDANPLDDVANTRRIRGVALDGRWLDSAAIDAMLEEVAKHAGA